MAENEDLEQEEGGEEEFEQGRSDPVREAVTAAFEKAETDSAQEENIEAVADKLRDEKGRFASKTPTDAPDVPAATTTETQAPEAVPPIELPSQLRADVREQLAKLPREAQEIFVNRIKEVEASFNRKHAQLDQTMRTYAAVDRAIAPHYQRLQQAGVSADQAIGQLLAADNYLEADPAGGLLWLMQSKGLTLEDLQAAQGQAAQVRRDPILEQRLARIETMYEAQERMEQERRQQSLLSDVSTFANETKDGQRTHPHFDKLADLIRPIVAHLRQTQPSEPNRVILEQAYEQALYAHPETRAAQLQAQIEAEKAKALQTQRQTADKARAAAVTLKGTPAGPAKAKPKSIRDAVAAAFDQHGF